MIIQAYLPVTGVCTPSHDEGDKGEGRLLTLPGGLVVEMAEGSEGDREARAELQYIHREIFEEGV